MQYQIYSNEYIKKAYKMANNEIQVIFETPPHHIYRPGDFVIGNVTTNLDPNVDLSGGITITLYGHAYVRWNEYQGSGMNSRSKEIAAVDQFFKLPQVYNASIHQTVYPFSFQIPDSRKSLPWTIKTSHGLVEYGVEARIKRNLLHFDICDNATFTLNSYLDSHTLSADNPDLSKILTSNCQKTNVGWYCFPFCCWYYSCAKENIKLTLSHQSILAMPGDEVPYTLDVDNSSPRRYLGDARIRLIAVWTHIAESSTRRYDQIIQEDIIQLGVYPGEEVTKSGIFKLPHGLVPTQVECKVIKLTYILQVFLNEMTGFRCYPKPATVETDLLIGNA